MKKYTFINMLILVPMVICFGAISTQYAYGESTPKILILPFDNMTRDVSIKSLIQDIPTLLELFFSKSNGYLIVDRTNLESILNEQKMAVEWPLGNSDSQAIGKVMQASVIVSGGYVKHNNKLIINAQVYDVETGRLLVSAKEKGIQENFVRMIKKMFRTLSKGLSKELPPLMQAQVNDNPLTNLHFMHGLSLYYSGQYNQAISEFIQAREDDDLSQIAEVWIANSYFAEAEYGHAYIELRRIMATAKNQDNLEGLEQKLNDCLANLTLEDVKLYNLILEE